MPETAGRDIVHPHAAAEGIHLLAGGGKVKDDFKPEVNLPGGAHSVSDTALNLGRLMGWSQKCYFRGGTVVLVNDLKDRLDMVQANAAAMTSAFEDVAVMVKSKQVNGEWVTERAICSEATARQVLSSEKFKSSLPVLNLVSPCAVLTPRDGGLVEVVGYDRKSGIYASGKRPANVGLKEAKELLLECLGEFKFGSPGDHARAVAALITPSLIFGGILKDRAPLDLGEADKSQTGKGYRHKITSAIYGQKVRTVTQQKGGPGSMEEAVDSALIAGALFICLDNVKGRVNSPKIESLLTEDSYSARVPYREAVNVDPARTCLMMTSNNADLETDLANRCSCVRLLKRDDGHEFRQYPEGDILCHVRANQPKYLGAVLAIVRDWHKRGMPKTRETRHARYLWAQCLDYIVQEYFDCGPLLDGHKEAQMRMTNPTLGWMREVMLAMRDMKRQGEWMRTGHILDVLSETEVRIPGLKDDEVLAEDHVRKRVLQAMGRKLSICFRAEDEIVIDGHIARRRVWVNPMNSSESKEYCFLEGEEIPF